MSSEALGEVDRLTRLLELHEKFHDPRSRRWPAAIMLIGALMAVTLLMAIHVRQADIELELELSGAAFTLAQPQPLTGNLSLSALRASGIHNLAYADGSPLGRNDAASIAPQAVELSVAGAGRRGSVTLAPLPATKHVSLTTKSDGALGIRLSGPTRSLRVTLHGQVRIRSSDGGDRIVDFGVPRSLTFMTDSIGTDLELVPGEGDHPPALELSPQLAVRELELSRIDELQQTDGLEVQHVSTILSGAMAFASLDDAEVRLRPRELLHFQGVRGIIRDLRTSATGIHLNFRGRIAGLSSGWGDPPANRMPTLLDWLRARHGLSLLWGSTLYLFGVLATIAKWLGRRP